MNVWPPTISKYLCRSCASKTWIINDHTAGIPGISASLNNLWTDWADSEFQNYLSMTVAKSRILLWQSKLGRESMLAGPRLKIVDMFFKRVDHCQLLVIWPATTAGCQNFLDRPFGTTWKSPRWQRLCAWWGDIFYHRQPDSLKYAAVIIPNLPIQSTIIDIYILNSHVYYI